MRWESGGQVTRYMCQFREDHDGLHKDPSGATWEEGDSDFPPPPDGYS